VSEIPVSNAELWSTRDFMRQGHELLVKLKKGNLDKVVLTRGGRMEAVVLTVERYAELMGDGEDG
jgi:hypothetical protein